MWTSWFGGYTQPSDYATSEMPCRMNPTTLVVSALFVVPYIAFLIVLPGVREKKWVTLVTVTLVAFVGAVLAASLYYPGWTVGSAKIVSQFRAHTNERMLADLGVNVGLQNLNITLKFEQRMYSDDIYSNVDMSQLYYNEQFDITGVSSMVEELRAAYLHGLPYPMLSVLEYFSLNQDAFDWGRHYRTAGHYTHAAVWFSFSLWMVSVALLLLVPHQFCRSITLSGLASLLACLLYRLMSPTQLKIAFTGVHGARVFMEMRFGWCFWVVFAAGIISLVCGVSLMLLQHCRVYTLSTFLDARIDDTVGPKARWSGTTTENLDLAPTIEVMRRVKPVSQANSKAGSEKAGGSSGFQSRSSCTASLRSNCSFESTHGLERAASNLTLDQYEARKKASLASQTSESR